MSDLRPVGPIGAPAIGTPPVAAWRVLQAGESHGTSESRSAAARRVFPQLTEEQTNAVFTQADLDPSELVVRASAAQILPLALLLGAGASLCSLGVLAVVADSVLYGLVPRFVPSAGLTPSADDTLLGALAIVALVFLGRGLLRLRPAARVIATLLGWLIVVAQLATLIRGLPTSSMLLSTGCCWAALLAPPVRPWCSDDGRAASAALPVKGYVMGALVLGLVLGSLLTVAPSFGFLYQEAGLRLTAGTEALLEISRVVGGFNALVPPLVVLLPLPLLLLRPRHEYTARVACTVLGLGLGSGVGGWLLLPMGQLL